MRQDWLTNFNSMSTCLGLFYANKLGILIHIYIFCSCLSSWGGGVTHIPIKYKLFLSRPIWPIGGILAGSTTLDQSEPGSNGNEDVLHTPKFSWVGTSPRFQVLLYNSHNLTSVICFHTL